MSPFVIILQPSYPGWIQAPIARLSRLCKQVLNAPVRPFASPSYPTDLDPVAPLVNEIDDPPVAHPHSIDIIVEFFTSGRPGVLAKRSECSEDSTVVWFMQRV